jgi:hypothetical protein
MCWYLQGVEKNRCECLFSQQLFSTLGSLLQSHLDDENFGPAHGTCEDSMQPNSGYPSVWSKIVLIEVPRALKFYHTLLSNLYLTHSYFLFYYSWGPG